MTSKTSPEIHAHLISLQLISQEINEAANAAEREVKEVDRLLEEIGVGIDATSPRKFSEALLSDRSKPGVEVTRERRLAYGRFGSKFCIHVEESIEEWDKSREGTQDASNEDTGMYAGETLSTERLSWSSLSRAEKIVSARYLHSLVGMLEDAAMHLLWGQVRPDPGVAFEEQARAYSDWHREASARFGIGDGCPSCEAATGNLRVRGKAAAADVSPPVPTKAVRESRRSGRKTSKVSRKPSPCSA